MRRAPYRLEELLDRAKAAVREGITGVGTEEGSDHDLVLHAATRLLQGSQVAAAYLRDQLVPSSADADHRSALATRLGLTFERAATPARGLVALFRADGAGFQLPAGAVITFPGSAFLDGVERAYRTLEDVDAVVATPSVPVPLAVGSSLTKLRPARATGVTGIGVRDVVRVATDVGAGEHWAVVRRVNADDGSLDLYAPLTGALRNVGETVALHATGAVVPVEAVTAGALGNAPAVQAHVDLPALGAGGYAVLVESGGGGDAVGPEPLDSARVVAQLEDTIACPPGFGNDQQWRELVLSCPDVTLDDAVVYRHVRGPGTIDLVAIGPSGSLTAPSFSDAPLGFVPWGLNTRRIGEEQAARLEQWCKARASYFDDVRVRSVEWDHRGNTFAESGYPRFLYAVSRVDVRIAAEDGYGPDAGVALDVIPHTRDRTRLYPARLSGKIDARLRPGHRVWAAVGHRTTTGRHPFATVVTEVLSVAHDRSYATIRAVSGLAPGDPDEVFAGTDNLDLTVLRWGSAGPLTAPVVQAVFAYFDRLGPGSYPLAPKGPGYARRFGGGGVTAPVLSQGLSRWPPEGRRWSSGLRQSELTEALLAIEGVRAVAFAGLADGLLDYDPLPLHTLALNGVLPRYA